MKATKPCTSYKKRKRKKGRDVTFPQCTRSSSAARAPLCLEGKHRRPGQTPENKEKKKDGGNEKKNEKCIAVNVLGADGCRNGRPSVFFEPG